MNVLHRLIEQGVTVDMTVTDAKHVRFTNVAALLVALMVLPWVPVNFFAGETFMAVEGFVAGFLLLLAFPVNHRGNHREAVIILLFGGMVQMAFTTWIFGVESGAYLYYLLAAFAPYLLFRKQHQWAAHGFSSLAVVLLILFIVFEYQFPRQAGFMDNESFYRINMAVVATCLLVMAAVFRNFVTDTENALEAEQARADKLLLNVLPASVADRLKRSPKTKIADRYEQVTVLFADIVGFTPLSAKMTAEYTVDLLNQIFTEFDGICDRFGVEKIRTIGDGYMAVAGAPDHRGDHAEVMINVARLMRDYMESKPVSEPLQVRIGLNSGEVVAGIVGTTRFHFDLWGDAVNIAARMESLGEPGRIHIAK